MYLRNVHVKGNDYLLIVASEWRDGRSKQRVVKYLGRADRLNRDEVRSLLAQLRVTRG